ncbi:2-oxoadipate dioxygenase/decarboxylase family protein [Embleya sp. NPDC008237]|uniref:2-oxoadipate dioxygenase/decarboxylase n=1 Tax=Embleya sp. NPDC008237 TaxID=3363978 RepID=UPI0036E53C13
MGTVPAWQLRAAFARRLSDMYGSEVPAYTTLLAAVAEINEDVSRIDGAAGRLGGIERVAAERHGAIRVGTARELRRVAAIFGAMGMHPVGFYDLREASRSSVPVVSTAFRPIEPAELARNPFRVFTSLLTTADRRYFDPDLQARLEAFLAARELFPAELSELAERAEREAGLDPESAERFLTLAVDAFRLSTTPIDRAWYEELARVSAVAADIGGVSGTHINHLTPRVLDIDRLYREMGRRGITMIDEIQGPPRWDGPDVLLRQTSFRALEEQRRFRDADGGTGTAPLRVRFGEVEARGIALTATGRALYDDLMAETDRRSEGEAPTDRAGIAREVWTARFPRTERELALNGQAFFTYRAVAADRRPADRQPPADLAGLLDQGWIDAEPIVYEDFLPRSAAGIFQSNLTDAGTRDTARSGAHYDRQWLAEVIGRPVHDPVDLYGAQQQASLAEARAALGLAPAAPA